MFFKIILLIMGFMLTVSSGIGLLAYLNLLVVGYSLKEYVFFIIGRMELYSFLIGIMMVYSSLYLTLRKMNERKK